MNTINEMLKDEALVADGYERVKEYLAEIPAEQLLQLNLDVQSATRTMLGALPEMRQFRDQLEKLHGFDIEAFDRLEDLVQAMKYAQGNYQIALEPPDDLLDLTTQAQKMRDRLLADAHALSTFGLFSANTLEKLKGGNGYNNLAEDLELLSRAMTTEWERISAKSHHTLEDIEAASRMGFRLTRIAGLREQGPARLAAATELRLRAFTAMIRTYEDARSGIEFLRRREGDAETIAPTLYNGGRRRRQPGDDTQPVVPGTTQPAPVTPAVTSQAPPANSNGASPQPTPKVDPRGPFIS